MVSREEMRVVSGGQTGADRAALDIAQELGLPYGGWVPRNGWAEDFTVAPGVLAKYPRMRPVETEDLASSLIDRTRRNVLDSSATLILITKAGQDISPGTVLTKETAEKAGRPCLVVRVDADNAASRITDWLDEIGPVRVLNVAGPRATEAPELYAKAVVVLRSVFRAFVGT